MGIYSFNETDLMLDWFLLQPIFKYHGRHY